MNAKKTVTLSPSDGGTDVTAGIIFSRSGFYQDSITYFKKALRLEPYYFF